MQNIKYKRGLISEIAEADDGRHGYSSGYVQVNYNMKTRECWGDYHYCVGRNDWSEYSSPDIITVGKYQGRITRKALAADISLAIAERM